LPEDKYEEEFNRTKTCHTNIIVQNFERGEYKVRHKLLQRLLSISLNPN